MGFGTSEPSALIQLTTSTTPLCFKIPPSSIGLKIWIISSIPAEGWCIPGISGINPVIFETAHISIADFVPSWKELYI